ncbi:hypothetical protein SAMN05428988_2726 [Chitinophaga sp. YR573]|uniref:hypothetical protein n=1 Tax=Chitinophaga sp. YR573 TaxID=1881040 RepID=UPI0008B435A7|nr:hypothetical protein [Chitinophaga sp. YR573]SEW17360.1 hypothetical protein SAMN05428988_2726 [Chitinophaga sp. YR573]
MTLRADFAIQQGHLPLAKQLLDEVKTSQLFSNNREKYKAEYQRVADLEQKML